MSSPQPPSTPHLYSQSLQLKLYQAFIFSIPILFSIILFLLFYLFYLKRSFSPASSPQPTLPRSSNESPFSSSSETVLKGKLKEKLQIILFDDELKTRDSTCCVCLGEFETNQELHQITTCKHVFHMDCICYWLRSNPTCPLCRCFIVSTTAKHNRSSNLQPPYGRPDPITQQQQQQVVVTIPQDVANV